MCAATVACSGVRGPGVPVGEFISVAPPSVKHRQDDDGGRRDKR